MVFYIQMFGYKMVENYQENLIKLKNYNFPQNLFERSFEKQGLSTKAPN